MQYVHVDDLKGKEILAEPILTSTDIVLLHADTLLKKEYIEKLKELNINYVYIKSEIKAEDDRDTSIDMIKKNSLELVKDILDHHIYKRNSNLKEIGAAAEKIMESIVSEPQVIYSLTEIKEKSTDLYSHLVNVCTFSTIVAVSMKLKEAQIKDIALGAIMHDIGLKYITAHYYNMDMQDMSTSELIEYKKHTVYGYTSLLEAQWISDVSKEIILLHHEREDGTGFPFQKKDDKLRTEVKIVSVCDDFDSLISGIGNKKMKIYKAIEYLKIWSGVKYDKMVVDKLVEFIALYPIGMKVVTSEDEVGIVVRQNQYFTDRPVLKMLQYANGKEYKEEVYKNLMEILTLFIVDTLE